MVIDENNKDTDGTTVESEDPGKGLENKRCKGDNGNSQSLSTSSAGSFDRHLRDQ
jgi:hypothetical protein